MENYHKGTLAYDDIGAFIAHRVDTPTKDIAEMSYFGRFHGQFTRQYFSWKAIWR